MAVTEAHQIRALGTLSGLLGVWGLLGCSDATTQTMITKSLSIYQVCWKQFKEAGALIGDLPFVTAQ